MKSLKKQIYLISIFLLMAPLMFFNCYAPPPDYYGSYSTRNNNNDRDSDRVSSSRRSSSRRSSSGGSGGSSNIRPKTYGFTSFSPENNADNGGSNNGGNNNGGNNNGGNNNGGNNNGGNNNGGNNNGENNNGGNNQDDTPRGRCVQNEIRKGANESVANEICHALCIFEESDAIDDCIQSDTQLCIGLEIERGTAQTEARIVCNNPSHRCFTIIKEYRELRPRPIERERSLSDEQIRAICQRRISISVSASPGSLL